jgi:hypothetical protein
MMVPVCIDQLSILATGTSPSPFPWQCGATFTVLTRSRAWLLDARQKENENLKIADAMYSSYSSTDVSRAGLIGLDGDPLQVPAPTSTATTRIHNQPQPHLPLRAVVTALQNNHDDAHLAANEACLCSLCHIKDRFFPRRRDGRIVLPHPTTISAHSHSTRLHGPTASMTSAAPLATSALTTHRRNRTDSTASNRDRDWGAGFWNLLV